MVTTYPRNCERTPKMPSSRPEMAFADAAGLMQVGNGVRRYCWPSAQWISDGGYALLRHSYYEGELHTSECVLSLSDITACDWESIGTGWRRMGGLDELGCHTGQHMHPTAIPAKK